MRSAGDLSYSSSLGYVWATRHWDPQGNLADSGCRRDYSYNSHYLEYGYSYYYTLLGGALLASASCAGETTTGLGDLRFGARGRTDIYKNYRTWEVVATVPTQDASAESPKLGCRAWGLSGALARKDDLMPALALGSSLGLQLWEGPLSHQVEGSLGLSGPLRGFGRLRWGFDIDGRAPLEDQGPVAGDISDCGTNGKVVKTGLRLGMSLSKQVFTDCAYSRAVWGEDATQSQGFSCGFSYLWN